MKLVLLLFVASVSVYSSGCALKAPLVTEALPITKIKAYKTAKTPSKPATAAAPSPNATPGASTPATPAVAMGSAPATPGIPAANPAPVTTAVSEEISTEEISSPVGTQTYYLAGSNKLPPLAKALQIQTMTFRSLLVDPNDQSEDARKNDSLVDQCPDGRSNLDFIQSVAVGVRHSKEQDSQAVVIATYTQAIKGLCGFHLTPSNFDMKDYASDYVFVIQVTGSLPPAALSISGYYTAQDYEGL